MTLLLQCCYTVSRLLSHFCFTFQILKHHRRPPLKQVKSPFSTPGDEKAPAVDPGASPSPSGVGAGASFEGLHTQLVAMMMTEHVFAVFKGATLVAEKGGVRYKVQGGKQGLVVAYTAGKGWVL
jgi:hypothetical protein